MINPYFSITLDFILAIFTAGVVTFLGYAAFRRSLLHDEATLQDQQLRKEVESLRAENASLREEMATLRNDYNELKRESALCKAARVTLVEVAVELSRQLREVGEIPKLDINALMSGMNEGAL